MLMPGSSVTGKRWNAVKRVLPARFFYPILSFPIPLKFPATTNCYDEKISLFFNGITMPVPIIRAVHCHADQSFFPEQDEAG